MSLVPAAERVGAEVQITARRVVVRMAQASGGQPYGELTRSGFVEVQGDDLIPAG
jgi:hypothetical protein